MGSDTELAYEADPPDTRLRLELPAHTGRSADAILVPQGPVLPDGDSGDDLFQTQPVALPLRTERRERPQRLQLPSTASESDTDSEAEGCPQRSWKSFLKFQRYKPSQETQKKYDRNGPAFPFLAKKNNKSEHLPRRKVLLFEHGAIGGFFTYMKNVKDKSEKGLPSRFLSLRRRFVDEDGELLPFSNLGQAEDSQASDDIKIVAQKDFILKFHGRFRGHNTWTEKFSGHAGQDSVKDGRKASSKQKKSIHVPKVQTRSRVRRSSSTCNADIEDNDCSISKEREYNSDTTDLSSDTSPQEEDEECTVTDVLDPQGAVKPRKPTRTQRRIHTVKKKTSTAAVILRSSLLDAETAGNSEEMPNCELQQSPHVIQLEKQMTNRTENQCFFLPVESCAAGISNTGTPTKICEQGSLDGVTEDAIPHTGLQELWELGDISVKRKTERGKESLQERTLDASKGKVMEQTEKESVERAGLPEHRTSLSLTKEGIRKDEEALANPEVVVEDETPFTSYDDVHEMISTTAVNVQDEQDYAEHVPCENTPEKPIYKTSQIFEGSSGCKYELNKAIRKKLQVSQEVILNLDDVSDLREKGADSQNIELENEGFEELLDSNYGQRLVHGEERCVEEERTQDVYAQSTTDSQSKKPYAETACGKGEEEFSMWKSSKSERQRLETTCEKDLNMEDTYTTENVSLHTKILDLQDGLSEEGRDSAPVAKSQSQSSSCSYNQTKNKQVISETSADRISDIGSYPPEPKDNTDFDVACRDLEERRRKKRKRGEKEEQFSISGSQECLSALNSPMHKGSDRERYTEPAEMCPLSCSNDVVKKEKKRRKPWGAEESDELGGNFIANYSDSFLGGKNRERWNIAVDRSMEFESQGERSMTDPDHHNSVHQPSKKKHKKERDSDNSGCTKTRDISLSTVNLKTCVTGLRVSPGLTPRETKAGKSHEKKEKLVSNYDSVVSKLAGMDTDRDCHGKTTDIQEVSSGVNAIQEGSKVSQCKIRGRSLCDKEGHGSLPMVKRSPSKRRLFAIRRLQHLQQTGSYIHQTLIWNYLHSKKGNRQRQNST